MRDPAATSGAEEETPSRVDRESNSSLATRGQGTTTQVHDVHARVALLFRPMKRTFGAALMGLFAPFSLVSWLGAQGCGGTESPPPADAGPTVETLHPDAAPLPGESECTVIKTTNITISNAAHIGDCAPVTYETNPPSGGPHWPFWAKYKKYATPVPHEMLVHDMEHGAVILYYRCASACPEVEALLDGVMGMITDPLCLQIPGGPLGRVIVTPDPDLATPIAASAWGATYTATCIDQASLVDFVQAVYGHGPESLCADGKDIENGFVPCGAPVDAGADAADDASADAADDASGDGG